jgi:hypothetical protein
MATQREITVRVVTGFIIANPVAPSVKVLVTKVSLSMKINMKNN